MGTGSITVNSGATLDVNTTLIHNSKTNNGSIVNKPTPTFSFSNDSKSATYGDTGISADTLTENTNGAITYSSANTSIATVNSSSGAAASVAAGNTTITASAADTNEYAAAGGAIGAGIGAFFIISIWIGGAVLLGIPTYLTRVKN